MTLRKLFYGLCVIYMIKSCIPYTTIDPQLIKYNNDYLNIVKQYCTSTQYFHPLQTTMYFDDINKRHIAFCSRNRFTKMNIVVNTYYWNNSTDDMKYGTLVHEMTHCYFKVGHSQDRRHFMYSYENYLTRKEIDVQLIEFLKEQCK